MLAIISGAADDASLTGSTILGPNKTDMGWLGYYKMAVLGRSMGVFNSSSLYKHSFLATFSKGESSPSYSSSSLSYLSTNTIFLWVLGPYGVDIMFPAPIPKDWGQRVVVAVKIGKGPVLALVTPFGLFSMTSTISFSPNLLLFTQVLWWAFFQLGVAYFFKILTMILKSIQ